MVRGRLGIGTRPKRPAEVFEPPARPLIRPAPRSTMFFPLVVLVAVLPGLYALRNWDLNPPGPWWGLRALAVLDGRTWDQAQAASALPPGAEATAFRALSLQPPLYAWLAAAATALSTDRAPLATVLPSYAAGVLVVLLVYLHGRAWGGRGLGLAAAVLVGFNRGLLAQMQLASPTTLGLAGTLTALLAYVQHLRGEGPATRPGTSACWAVVGGLAIGLALLSVRGLALLAAPVVLLHQGFLGAEPMPGARASGWWRAWRDRPSLVAGAASLAFGLAVAAPWYAAMARSHGLELWRAQLAGLDFAGGTRGGLGATLLDLAPATLPLGLLGAARALRLSLSAEDDDPRVVGESFWLLWLAVAALAPAFWPTGPRAALDLFLLVPLSLLAARSLVDLAQRRAPARSLAWLAPATAMAVAWWASTHLRAAAADLAAGRRPDAASALGLHLGLDLIVATAILIRVLDRWARRRDDRQRLVLAGFLLTVVTTTVATGLREVEFRHRETSDLLALREMILRRHHARPFELVAVLGPDRDESGIAPGGQLRYILSATLPRTPRRDLSRIDDLLTLPDRPRLVILSGTDERLPYSLQSRLNLEAIHPGRSGVLDAFATTHDDPLTAAGPRAMAP
jgi:4-amino-4-deoxy-L-arabinose transferase-like glycosyltransferase